MVYFDGFPTVNAHAKRGIGQYVRTLQSNIAENIGNELKGKIVTRSSDFLLSKSKKNIIAHSLSMRGRGLYLAYLLQNKLMESEIGGCNIVHLNDPFRPIELKNKKTILTVYDLIPFRFSSRYIKKSDPISLFSSKAFKYNIMRADKIMAISKSTKQDIVDFFNVESEKISVVYPSFSRDVSNCKNLSYKPKKKYFLYVGAMDWRKNPRHLLEEFSKIHQRIDETLMFVGPGTEAIYPLVKSEFSQIQHKVEALGRVSNTQLEVSYRNATALVIPSLFEGFGLPVLEAFSYGCPVICSISGALPEAGGESATLFDPHRPGELANNLFEMSNDLTIRRRLEKKMISQLNKFSRENQINRFTELYKCLL